MSNPDGRPPLYDERLGKVFHVRIKNDMDAAIRAAADSMKCKPSEVVRTCIEAVIYDNHEAKLLGRVLRDAVVEYRSEGG